jgi:iron(III) transport system permease protein
MRTTFQTIFVAIFFATVLGALPAWLTHRFQFWGRKFFSFAFLAPITVPPAALLGLYQHATGSTLLNSFFGVGFCIGVATAPFVFLFFRVSLARISPAFREAAQTLGYGPLKRLLFVHIPLLAIPSLASAGLVASEVFSDFATASRAGVETFSVAFHNIWMGTQRNSVAALCVGVIAILLIVIFGLGMHSIRRFSPQNPPNTSVSGQHFTIPIRHQITVFLSLTLLLVPGFLFPVFQTVSLAIRRIGTKPIPNILPDTTNSLTSALLVSAFTFAFSLFVCRFFYESRRTQLLKILTTTSLFVYALPALALVFLVFTITSESSLLSSVFPALPNTRLPLLATTALRFTPFLLLPVLDSLTRIPEAQTHSARMLGCNKSKAFWRAIFPSIQPALIVGVAIVFIESVKEITISQSLQPFNYSSLAIKLFQFTNSQQVPESAVYILVMQIILLFPVLRLLEFLEKREH